jgi:hypothetical protein
MKSISSWANSFFALMAKNFFLKAYFKNIPSVPCVFSPSWNTTKYHQCK